MGSIKDLDSTAVYAYTTLISVIICVPLALIFEGGAIRQGITSAAESHPNFYYQLALVGLLYHLYNQVSASWTSSDTWLCCRHRLIPWVAIASLPQDSSNSLVTL